MQCPKCKQAGWFYLTGIETHVVTWTTDGTGDIHNAQNEDLIDHYASTHNKAATCQKCGHQGSAEEFEYKQQIGFEP